MSLVGDETGWPGPSGEADLRAASPAINHCCGPGEAWSGLAYVVIKDPPYKVEESGYAGFILPIEVYFRNKEEPKKVRFDYDLFLHLDGHPPVNHLRCEKLTFNSPTEEFRKKLLKAGGQLDPNKRSSEDSNVMVMQEGSTSLFGQHMKLPSLPSSLTSTFLDQKKSKSFHGSKNGLLFTEANAKLQGSMHVSSHDGSKGSSTTLLTTATTTSTNNISFSKLHKPSKDHKDKPPKDLKEPKSAFRDSGWESSKVPKEPKEPSRKPKENQPLRDINPKMGFKEPKSLSKEHRTEGDPWVGAKQASVQLRRRRSRDQKA
ncbi:hypothetical protein F7725_004245 [Dissostichus mawsoni]|uniref:YEATS domain-containing protein n=1 Tax=Dissostichus mawsoni TaxID=36200 RepID=A0A7J5XIL9_DISMA|nr:hypothetical protein F7725_004245 [Dissostichus mawsoni]